MFSFFKKQSRSNNVDEIERRVDELCGDFVTAARKRRLANERLIRNRRNSGFNNMMQAVFDDGYDLVDFETVREKYVGYFTGKTFLDSEEITRLLKDIYDAGVENQMTNRRIDAAVQNKRMEEKMG